MPFWHTNVCVKVLISHTSWIYGSLGSSFCWKQQQSYFSHFKLFFSYCEILFNWKKVLGLSKLAKTKNKNQSSLGDRKQEFGTAIHSKQSPGSEMPFTHAGLQNISGKFLSIHSGWTISGEKLINSVSRYLGGQRSNVFPLWLHCSDQCLCRCVI